jgi:hypothetical protein
MRCHKTARKRGYQVAALRVTNNTAQSLDFARDVVVYYGDRPITPVPATVASKDIRQGVPIYLLYLLLGSIRVGGTTDAYTGTTTGGVPVPVGLFVAGGNMLGAGLANSNMRKEFVQYDMMNKTINPGETIYGIVSLRENGVSPLRLALRNAAAAVPAAPQAVPAAPAAPAVQPLTPASVPTGGR